MENIIRNFITTYKNLDDYENTLLFLSYKYHGKTLDAYNTVLFSHNKERYLIPSESHFIGFLSTPFANILFPIVTNKSIYIVVISWVVKYLYESYDVINDYDFYKIVKVTDNHDLDLNLIKGKRTFAITDENTLLLRYHGISKYINHEHDGNLMSPVVEFKIDDNIHKIINMMYLMYNLSVGYELRCEEESRINFEFLSETADLADKKEIDLY